MITINSLDHLVMTVRDLDVTIDFYQRVLGMTSQTFGSEQRRSLHFSNQKINLHLAGHEFEPKAHVALPGTADLCFISQTPMDEIVAHLHREQIEIIDGPRPRTGAMSKLNSIYFRDPDQNLIEVSNEAQG